MVERAYQLKVDGELTTLKNANPSHFAYTAFQKLVTIGLYSPNKFIVNDAIDRETFAQLVTLIAGYTGNIEYEYKAMSKIKQNNSNNNFNYEDSKTLDVYQIKIPNDIYLKAGMLIVSNEKKRFFHDFKELYENNVEFENDLSNDIEGTLSVFSKDNLLYSVSKEADFTVFNFPVFISQPTLIFTYLNGSESDTAIVKRYLPEKINFNEYIKGRARNFKITYLDKEISIAIDQNFKNKEELVKYVNKQLENTGLSFRVEGKNNDFIFEELERHDGAFIRIYNETGGIENTISLYGVKVW